MSKKTNSSPASEEQAKEASAAEQNEQTAAQAKPEAEAAKQPEEKKHEDAKQQEASEFEKAQQALAQEHDSYLRLAAEYDNYRKRSQKEKDNLYTEIRSETVEKFLPVYDNLERALAQETQDAAFKKGVEMTMNQLVSVMEKLGVESFGAAGDHFDPQLHNAVMHIEDESLGENVIAEVFQKGFKVGEKVVRFAMVKVAN
ncbi:MAG: nucleotide exchange factor GrpE [Oscillospiraceae bacterium]|nr:nucleotide exchange factor GrpE [Oscillospiraceae bacterium]MCI6097020.1 nucleotide exchange factor GrpE [Clostridiales bacterium]MCI6527371.1 nucleotide exchange factor GrpE [Clostridiales bacterium]MCI7135459.1 nucleotide exchange factor GrpE [Clostridiales bacterium]MDD6543171.1 nucleotide exchange factor GrpE [Clostridiales bacterium]